MITPMALLFVGIYAAVAFGWRSWRQWRRTGSTGFRGISGRPLSAEWTGGVLFVVAMLLVPLAGTLDMMGVGRLSLPAASVPAGALLAALGFALTVWSQLSMGDAWRIGVDADERTKLVLRGAFTWVRNPIFSSMVLALAGFALLVPSLASVGAVLILVLAVQLQVRCVEEPYLARVHGDAYARYAGAVGRFVPGLGRRSAR